MSASLTSPHAHACLAHLLVQSYSAAKITLSFSALWAETAMKYSVTFVHWRKSNRSERQPNGGFTSFYACWVCCGFDQITNLVYTCCAFQPVATLHQFHFHVSAEVIFSRRSRVTLVTLEFSDFCNVDFHHKKIQPPCLHLLHCK